MSAETWVFPYVVETPYCKARCTVRWVGDADPYDPPSTDLSDAAAHLDLWLVIPFEIPYEAPFDVVWDLAATWVFENEAQVIQEIVNKAVPVWEWDT
jgi:hypothetical protein